jgi:hypothetical protein
MGPGGALAAAALLGRRVGLLQSFDELVADRLEVSEVGDRGVGGARGALLGIELRIGRELPFQARDLRPQGLAGGALVRLGELGVEVRGGRGLVDGVGLACRVDRAGELAGLDAERGRRLGSVGGGLLEGRRDPRMLGDEGPGAMAGDHQTLVLEPAVDRAGGVDVDPGPGAELAHPRQPGPGLETAALDQGPQPPPQLDAHRDVVSVRDFG